MRGGKREGLRDVSKGCWPRFQLCTSLAWLAKIELTQAAILPEPAPERIKKAKWAIEKTKSLTPDLSETHSAMAFYKQYVEQDSAGALSEFEVALRDQENSSEALLQQILNSP